MFIINNVCLGTNMYPLLLSNQLTTTDHSHSASIDRNICLLNSHQHIHCQHHHQSDIRPKFHLRPSSVCFFGFSKQTRGLVSFYYPAINKKYISCGFYAPSKCSNDSCEFDLSIYQAVVHLLGFRLPNILFYPAS